MSISIYVSDCIIRHSIDISFALSTTCLLIEVYLKLNHLHIQNPTTFTIQVNTYLEEDTNLTYSCFCSECIMLRFSSFSRGLSGLEHCQRRVLGF